MGISVGISASFRWIAAILGLEPEFKSRPSMERMRAATLTIGEVAAAVGLNASAVRYYERRGVMPPPERASGQRRYGPDAIARLRTIRVAQQVGLSLTEITQLLAGARDGKSTEVLRRLAERKLPDVEALIERAQAMKKWLELAADCRCASLDVCDLFAADDPRAPRSAGLH
jgi:MerR family redox-sensitive transcriptional activator SoxR